MKLINLCTNFFTALLFIVMGITSEAQERKIPSSQVVIKKNQPLEGIRPMPWLKSASNWYPETEDVQPDEIRVTLMGAVATINPGQIITSFYVELGNGDNFVFDIGEGAVANYATARIELNQINHVFITHLNADHFGSLPYLWMTRALDTGWHEPLTIHGPSGRTLDYGTKKMVEGMKLMLGWHIDDSDIYPVGKGHDILVNEFDFRDNGGMAYEKNGVKITHWQRSHARDGASGYKLEWNGMSVVWIGDGRPSELDIKYAKGADLFINELQPEVVAVNSDTQEFPHYVTDYISDTHQTPACAVGYLANEIRPRMFMTTQSDFNPSLSEKTVAEARHHWEGPYYFGVPVGIVVNMTKDAIWIREGVLPDNPNKGTPQFRFYNSQSIIPLPVESSEETEELFGQERQVDRASLYPVGYLPHFPEHWPVNSEVIVPVETLSESAEQSKEAEGKIQENGTKTIKDKKKVDVNDKNKH